MQGKLQLTIYRIYVIGRTLSRLCRLGPITKRTLGPLLAKLVFATGPNGQTPALVQGHKMVLAPSGRYPSPDMVMDKYEPMTTELFKQYLSGGMAVLDIGANIGYFTLLAAREVGPGGLVLAVEPEPQNNLLIKRNALLNGYNNIKIINKAVGNSVGEGSLFVSSLDNGSHSVNSSAARGVSEELIVNMTTVDRVLEDEEWPNIDLIKIDVEGAELKVLDGMTSLFCKMPCVKLLIEYCPLLLSASGTDPVEVNRVLKSYGYSLEFLDETRQQSIPVSTNLDLVTNQLNKSGSYINIFCTK